MKNDLKEKVIELRKQGMSYNEIRAIYPVSKSTLSVWLRDIELTPEQKQRLKQKEIDNRKSFPELMATRFTKEERLAFSKKGGINNLKLNPNFPRQGNAKAASLAYREAEIPIKEQLEKITGMEFRKEQINNKYIPYANDVFLVDYIKDPIKGAQWSIDRMAIIKDDPRIKMIISAPLSTTYLQRIQSQNLSGNNIILLCADSFWEGRFRPILLPQTPLDINQPGAEKLAQLLLANINQNPAPCN